MAIRKIYSCDWCGVDSDKPGYIGEYWQYIAREEYICKDCTAARTDAIDKVKNERSSRSKT